jgi:hypothetical protein
MKPGALAERAARGLYSHKKCRDELVENRQGILSQSGMHLSFPPFLSS